MSTVNENNGHRLKLTVNVLPDGQRTTIRQTVLTTTAQAVKIQTLQHRSEHKGKHMATAAAKKQLTTDDQKAILEALELSAQAYDRRSNMKGTDEAVRNIYKDKATATRQLIAGIRNYQLVLE